MLISLTNLNELSQENCYNSYSVHAWILHPFDHFKISILQGESYFSLLKFDSEEQKNGKKTNIFACGKPVKYLQCMFLCIVQIMSYTNFSNKLLFAFHVMLFFVSLKKNVVSVRLNQLYDKLEMKIRLQWT